MQPRPATPDTPPRPAPAAGGDLSPDLLPDLLRSEPADVRGVVLLLHGGTPASQAPVDARSASWRRMAAMQRSISPTLHAEGLATWLLRYRERGWNGDGTVQIADARAALDAVRREHGEVPVVLLGHSMGARTAVHAADHPLVRGVTALAPWFPLGEDVSALAGKHLRAAHGRADRITSARHTEQFVQRARRVAHTASMVDMGRIGHYMLRRVPAWNAFAADASRELIGR